MSRLNQSVVQNVDIQPKKQKRLVSYLLLFLGDSLAPSPSLPTLSLSLAKAHGKQRAKLVMTVMRNTSYICFSVMELT